MHIENWIGTKTAQSIKVDYTEIKFKEDTTMRMSEATKQINKLGLKIGFNAINRISHTEVEISSKPELIKFAIPMLNMVSVRASSIATMYVYGLNEKISVIFKDKSGYGFIDEITLDEARTLVKANAKHEEYILLVETAPHKYEIVTRK